MDCATRRRVRCAEHARSGVAPALPIHSSAPSRTLQHEIFDLTFGTQKQRPGIPRSADASTGRARTSPDEPVDVVEPGRFALVFTRRSIRRARPILR
jgi:hypothetical protein